jgi:hypothetical protein
MKQKITYSLLLAAILIGLVAFPIPAQASPNQATNTLARLTIDNRDAGGLYLTLRSPDNFYYLRVGGKEIKEFTVERDQYEYTLYGCGLKDTGIFDLTKNMKLVNPVCGGNARSTKTNTSAVDLSKALKLVRVYVVNETNQKTLVILTGPSTVVFWMDPGETHTYTIARQEYDVRFLACGVWNTTTFTPYKNATLHLRCAK